MIKEKNNMDDFLRGSLGDIEVKPSQNVWKKISKRLLILELIRFNFSNVSKYWLYSGMAALTTVAGLAYYNMDSKDLSTTLSSNVNDLAKTETLSSPENKEDKPETLQAFSSPETKPNETSLKEINTEANQAEAEILKEDLSQESLEEFIPIEEADDAIFKYTPEKKTEQVAPVNSLVVAEAIETNTSPKNTIEEPQKNTALEVQAEQNESVSSKDPELKKIAPKTAGGTSSNTIFIQKRGLVDIPPLLIGSQTKKAKFDAPKSKKKKQRTQKSKQWKGLSKKDSKNDLYGDKLIEKPTYSISLDYRHNWPMDFKDFIPQSNLFSLKGGISYHGFDARIGFGIQSEQNNTNYNAQYSSYDSVGFFYDIDYYETISGNPDSIIIHYTPRALYDTVNHNSSMEMKQASRWIVIPIELGYEILKRDSYVLAIGLSAQLGWEYYREQMIPYSGASLSGITYSSKGASSVNSYITVGLGLENQIKIIDNWWFIIEPRMFYYLKTPYKWEDSNTNGPFGFGVNAGIRFKF